MLQTSSLNVLTSIFGRSTSLINQSTWYFALGTGAITAVYDGSGWVEQSGGGYARVAYANTPSYWTTAGTTNHIYATNTQPIIWPVSTSAWSSMSSFSIWTALTGGTMYACGNLATPLTTLINDTLICPPSTFRIMMTTS